MRTDDQDQECTHVAAEEVRFEHQGYYWFEYYCIGCGELLKMTDPQPLWSNDDGC